MSAEIISPKKLIEVALPLDAINAAAAREKSIRHGHPSTLHLWWARRPLATARAVIFSQLVNDPEDLWRCQNPGKEPNRQVKGHWTKARARLFSIIEDLVLWENTTNEAVLEKAREEIRKSWREVCELNKDHPQAVALFDPGKMPGLHDPFAGGGAIPLEAQRLGLEAYASDLNPVAVLINKAMIEIPPKFTGMPPVNPGSQADRRLLSREWKGADGLAEDVRYYGQWIRDEAEKRIGHLYPKIEITPELAANRNDLSPYIGKKLTVVAWLWARTVASPNPAARGAHVPLVSSFVFGTKKGKEVYIEPAISGNTYRFDIRSGTPPNSAKAGTKLGRGSNFRCLITDAPISGEYLKQEGRAGRIGARLLAVVVKAKGRLYLPATSEQEQLALSAVPTGKPDQQLVGKCRDQLPLYGIETFAEIFTARQQVGLATLASLIHEVHSKLSDLCRLSQDSTTSTLSYAQAVCTYLAFALDRTCDYSSSVCTWHNGPKMEAIRNTFGRQALPMVWDFAEANLFSDSSGNWLQNIDWIVRCFPCFPASPSGMAVQADAKTQVLSQNRVVSTDPPYFDNIMYADLSDFFYVWLRQSVRSFFPELFATLVAPKSDELVASPYRHKKQSEAEGYFLDGMTIAMKQIASQCNPAFPLTIYYAFRQGETDSAGTVSSGWETFLEAVLRSGLSIMGTWPMRTELGNRILSRGTNALASSVVIVCRSRGQINNQVSRRAFIRELNEILPSALDAMTRESEGLHSPVAPVDLSQAIIGPGMAVFSKYSAVLEADGSPMSVRTALQLINRFLAEDDFDADTQFCLRWFEQHHWDAGQFGDADVLARAKGTSVEGVKQAGVIVAAGGKVRLLRPADYSPDWNPDTDRRIPVWQALHQLIRTLRSEGEMAAGTLLARVISQAEPARQLGYRLYTLCERAGMADDARAYNEVVTSWSGIESAAAKAPAASQRGLFDN